MWWTDEHCISAVSYWNLEREAADAAMDILLEVTGISQTERRNGGNEPLQSFDSLTTASGAMEIKLKIQNILPQTSWIWLRALHQSVCNCALLTFQEYFPPESVTGMRLLSLRKREVKQIG